MISDLSFTEENYLKAIYHLSEDGTESVNTNSLAESICTTPASVNDMMKKLSSKNLIGYKKYKGATLLPAGRASALSVIRKHRLWEVFLVDKLSFKWDEVHEIAEQLEHIKSPILVERLDQFLGRPTLDPHGDPIPDENGVFKEVVKAPLSDLAVGSMGILVHVNNDDPALLQHLDKLKISLSSRVEILEKIAFDGSVCVKIDDQDQHFISSSVANCLLITLTD